MNFNLLPLLCEKFTLYLIFPGVILLGVYLTFRLRCVQVLRLKSGFSALLKGEKHAEGNISHYQAISAILAGNFGTGNISGMAIALAMGGPGALVWMWVMAFLGSVIQFASCFLGMKYRTKNKQGEYVGGPMYYLRDGLGLKGLGMLFAVLVVVASFAVGSFVQINSIALPLQCLGCPPAVLGGAMAVLVGIVILGGISRVAKVAAAVVPIMALIYFGTALFIIARHFEAVPEALALMFRSAFGGSALMGGTLGYGLARAITTGFDRAIFATDAGTGSVPILQASAKSSHPVGGGIVSLVAPFLVMVVCTATGLVLILTHTWSLVGVKSTNLVTRAFSRGMGSSLGSYVVIVSLALFAYTTILAWASCGQKAIEFLFGQKGGRLFRWVFILMVPLGALLRVEFVWLLADLSLTAMLLINLVGIAGLSKEVVSDTKDFFFSKTLSSVK